VGSDVAFAQTAPEFALLGRANRKVGQSADCSNHIGTVAEAFQLAEVRGSESAALRMALKVGFADSRMLDLHVARIIEKNYCLGGRLVTQLKDLGNALVFAHANGLSLPLSEKIAQSFSRLC
jgi:2-hydroxy-3-oxopropionate reductase